jgi:hypothetical protein
MTMAARRTRRKTARRSRAPRTLNLAGIAESALIANAVTQGFFNTSLQEFVSQSPGQMNQITARELISGITGGSFGTQGTLRTAKIGGGYQISATGSPFAQTVRDNLANNGAAMVGQLILIPAGFKVFTKLTRKPRTTLNKALKMSGLPLKV